MAKTKADYEALGKAGAKNRGPRNHPFPREVRDKSWQARAYWDAFDAEVVRIEAEFDEASKKVIAGHQVPVAIKVSVTIPKNSCATKILDDEERARQGYANWPRAAAEHVRLLKEALAKEPSQGRRARLKAAIQRLIIKHGRPA